MNRRHFAKYLARDLFCVCGCQGQEDTYVPQHRANRGMGGSKELDPPSNIIVLCSRMNGLIESDAAQAERARRLGWKLERWQDPTEWPVFDAARGEWVLLDDDYQRKTIQKEAA